MKFPIIGAVILTVISTLAQAQVKPQDNMPPGARAEIDSQARTVPGTVTSPNQENAAIAKVEAAGKNPNPRPRIPEVEAPGGPATSENNRGTR